MAYDFARPLNVILPELVSALAMAQADLARPIVYFTSATIPPIPEGNSGTKTLTLTARRSTLTGALNVSGTFVQGTAVAADFPGGLPGNKVWAFSAGSDTATVDIAINGDTDVEGNETFGYQLQPGSTYRLGSPSSVTGTILNDDSAAPTITPMPSGVVAMWDPATLALANGATVTEWTDSVGGSTTAYTGDSAAKHTFIAASGANDLPAVRLSGEAVLATSGTNAANTALTTGAGQGIIVVARNFNTPGNGSVGPCLVAVGTNTNGMLQATPTETGKYQAMTDCADAGMRTIGYSATGSTTFMGVNGTMIAVFGQAFGQVTIGGWQNRAQQYCGRADILAVIVFNRTVTSADFKQVHRRYCDLLKQAYPGGGTRKTYVAIGDSITYGTGANLKTSYPANIAKALNLPWGTWDNLGVQGMTWNDIRNGVVPSMGNIAGVTGQPVVVSMFEFANMRTGTVLQATSAARTVIDLLRSNDPNVSIVFGTSTDDGSVTGQQTKAKRVEYNTYWDDAANRSGITSYVRIHLDPNIGVDGAAPTNGTSNAYYDGDNLHLNAGGYVVLDSGPYGFRPAVSALLA